MIEWYNKMDELADGLARLTAIDVIGLIVYLIERIARIWRSTGKGTAAGLLKEAFSNES